MVLHKLNKLKSRVAKNNRHSFNDGIEMAKIVLTRVLSEVGFDNVDFDILVNDFKFSFNTYLEEKSLFNIEEKLSKFCQVFPNSYLMMDYGSFGINYAGGALQLSFESNPRGRIFVSVSAESEPFLFNSEMVVSIFKTYCETELNSIQEFLDEIRNFLSRKSDTVLLTLRE